MKNSDNLVLSLRLENYIGNRRALWLVIAVFLLLGLPWLMSMPELFRQEGLFAAVAADYVDNVWDPAAGITAQAHGMAHSDVWPLYPAVVSLLYRCHIPMEVSLRVISAVMLAILSLLAGIAAAKRSSFRGGVVAGCCCFGTLYAMEKGVYGGPETMAACFLLTAQLLFFHYGSRLADWNSAWISSAVFLSLGFLTVGPVLLLFFIFPLIFLRRPLSFAGKFRTPGFLIGIVLLLIVILTWALPFGISLRHYTGTTDWYMIFTGKYWEDVLLFLVKFPLRMLPWTLVMWMPFCVALQSVSPAPVFSRYLRTLFFAMLALCWLVPGASSKLIFFLLGPVAILTGMSYELGVRRYGTFLRRTLIVLGFFFPLAILSVIGIGFLPSGFISWFLDGESVLPRDVISGYIYLVSGGVLMLAVLCFFYSYGHRRYPVWVQIILLCSGIGVINTVEILPFKLIENDWRKFGHDIRAALPDDTARIYKYDIDGMYCGLFYVGLPISKLNSLEELDSIGNTVYVISAKVPVYPEMVWKPLLPDGYMCKDIQVSLWRGEKLDIKWDSADE